VLKLGKLSDDEVNKWRLLLETIKKPGTFATTLEDIIVTRHYAYLDIAVANVIWDYWGLDKVFKEDSKRDVSIANIAGILTINRCIDPAAKSKTPEWFRKTALPCLLEIKPNQINPSRIFRELVSIEKRKELICEHLFKRLSYDNPVSMESIFYDLSSSSFSGTHCVLMKYGHCKDGYKNHIVLALVVNKDGLPFYWEILPGGTSDAKTINWLFERLNTRFEINNTTLVFDRGMVSDDNLSTLESGEIKYISAMDKNQIEGITGIDFKKYSCLKPEIIKKQTSILKGFTKMNDNTYYLEIKIEDKRRYIICFNPQLFTDRRNAREQALENFKAFVNDSNIQLLEAKNSRQYEPTYTKFKKKISKAKLNKFVDISLKNIDITLKRSDGTERKILTYQASVIVDGKKKITAGKLDGFWLLVTNHTEKVKQKYIMCPQALIQPYRDKTIIESAFRDIKSFVEIEPIFVWTDLHVKAHYTICVLSYLINRTLSIRLHKQKGTLTKAIITHKRLYEELSDCQIDMIEVNNIQKRKHSITRPTNKQKELLKRIGIKNLNKKKFLEKADYLEQN